MTTANDRDDRVFAKLNRLWDEAEHRVLRGDLSALADLEAVGAARIALGDRGFTTVFGHVIGPCLADRGFAGLSKPGATYTPCLSLCSTVMARLSKSSKNRTWRADTYSGVYLVWSGTIR